MDDQGGRMTETETIWITEFDTIATSDLTIANYALRAYHKLFDRLSVNERVRFVGHVQRLSAMLTCSGGGLDDQPQACPPDRMARTLRDLFDEDDIDADENPAPDTATQRKQAQLDNLPAGYLALLDEAVVARGDSVVVSVLGEALRLDGHERTLLGFVELLYNNPQLGSLLRASPRMPLYWNVTALAAILNVSRRDCLDLLGKQGRLQRLDLIEVASQSDLEDFVRASETCIRVFDTEPTTVEALMRLFLEPLGESSNSLQAFSHLGAARLRVADALAHACTEQVKGVNALFHGAPGTGKTAFATALASGLGLVTYAVRTMGEDGLGLERRGRLSAYVLAQSLLTDCPGSLLIFDEAEDVFHQHGDFFAALSGYSPSRDKGWLNRLLEQNPVPTIWISNAVDSMDPAVLRRFLLPLEFRIPPRRVRRSMAEQMLADRGVSDELLDMLADDVSLSPALLRTAQQLISLLPAHDPDATVREGIRALSALSQPLTTSRIRRSLLRPDLDLLNLDGIESPAALIAGMQRSGKGRLCLHGVPGTGKTQFAELLAEALGRELKVASASTLLSPYVGETERNLAELFRGADPEHVVILLDEVDSFLADRRHAQRSWERTQVNELLQQMERYEGVFIAATNMVDAIDPAALRRFDLKIGFFPLSTEQRERAFVSAVGLLADQRLPETVQRRLAELTELTLGDIANVCRQQEVFGEPLAMQQFLERLRVEHATRCQRTTQER